MPARSGAISRPLPLTNKAGISLRVEYVSSSLLKPAPRQLRRRSRQHVQRLARSMAEFGCLVPIIVDLRMQIAAGHGR